LAVSLSVDVDEVVSFSGIGVVGEGALGVDEEDDHEVELTPSMYGTNEGTNEGKNEEGRE
jgi:hypothetical protein